jgi:hypothetical protein
MFASRYIRRENTTGTTAVAPVPPQPRTIDFTGPGPHRPGMGKTFEGITPELAEFIRAQSVFFVASAPTGPDGRVNLSPKGLDTLRVLAPDRVAYLDLTGSGNETAAHLGENGRITLMLCSFERAPRILRLYGRGRAVLPGDAEWATLQPLFPDIPGTRQIIVAQLTRVQTSCGFGLPLMELRGERQALVRWAEAKGSAGLAEYRRRKNVESIDGLPVRVADQTTAGPASAEG